jgi:ATP-dependent protease ClpP protease subunit
MTWFSVDRFGDTAKVFIREEIGLLAEARELIEQLTDAPKVLLSIDSFGGDVRAAQLIRESLLGRCPVATITGVCGSAAVIIMLAAHKVEILPAARVMIHPPNWFASYEQASGLRRMADVLDTISVQFIELLARRTGDLERARSWFTGPDFWFTAEEALACGLVDSIVAPPISDAVEPASSELSHPSVAVKRACPDPGEKLLIDFLNTFGPVTTTDRRRLMRNLSAWMSVNVRDA